MQLIQDYPGLQERDGWFERAYRTGDDVARVRICPVDVQPGNADQVVGSQLPIMLAVRMSASLVDGDGQVLRMLGRLCVSDEQVHAWAVTDGADFDVEAWLVDRATVTLAPLQNTMTVWRSAQILLPKPPAYSPEPNAPLAMIPLAPTDQDPENSA